MNYTGDSDVQHLHWVSRKQNMCVCKTLSLSVKPIECHNVIPISRIKSQSQMQAPVHEGYCILLCILHTGVDLKPFTVQAAIVIFVGTLIPFKCP